MTSIWLAAAVTGIIAGAEARRDGLGSETDVWNLEPLGDKDKHDCRGKNACKGQGGCKTDKHACKGQNACKGQGGCKSSMSAPSSTLG